MLIPLNKKKKKKLYKKINNIKIQIDSLLSIIYFSYDLIPHFIFFFFFFFLMIRRPPRSTLFPYRRSSDLNSPRHSACETARLAMCQTSRGSVADTRPLPTAVENIETVVKLEQHFLEERTLIDRMGDAIGAFVGTMMFVLVHGVIFLLWVLINVGLIPGIPAFDPFPFMLLAMAVSLEGVLLTTFVLMKQNRMSKRAEQRDQ